MLPMRRLDIYVTTILRDRCFGVELAGRALEENRATPSSASSSGCKVR